MPNIRIIYTIGQNFVETYRIDADDFIFDAIGYTTDIVQITEGNIAPIVTNYIRNTSSTGSITIKILVTKDFANTYIKGDIITITVNTANNTQQLGVTFLEITAQIERSKSQSI